MLLPVFGREIEFERIAPARPRPGARPIVFLHEALGSAGLWRDVPRQLAETTGCEAITYSRHGHGGSTPRPEPYAPSYLHDEALVWLPAILEALRVDRPFLIGHSDGGSIALIHAGCGRRAVSGLVVLAPHVMVEDESLAGIEAAKRQYETTDFRRRLACHHLDGAAVFRRWYDVWTSPEYRAWNIEDCLPAIDCPILAIQGQADEYGTMEQLHRIERQARTVALLKLADCGHAPHRDQPEVVIAAIGEFIGVITGGIQQAAPAASRQPRAAV